MFVTIRKVIGTFIDSDPAPFMTNLFLFYLENKWILKLKKSNMHKAHSFTNMFCFIDEFCAVNSNGLCEKHF